MMHILWRGGILTFQARPDHQRESFQTLHSEGSILHKLYCTGLLFPIFHFAIVFFTVLSTLLTILYWKRPMFLKKLLLFRYSIPNLTIAFHFWQYWKCLKYHICPGLSFCPCTEVFQNVNILLSCWIAQQSPQELPLDVANTFRLLTKFRLFFLLKKKLSSGCLCSMWLHRGQGPPGNGSDLSGWEGLTATLQEKTLSSTCWGWICGFWPSCGRELAPEKHVPTLDPTVPSRILDVIPKARNLWHDYWKHDTWALHYNWSKNVKIKLYSQVKLLQWERVTVIIWAESHSTVSILHSREKKTKPQTNTAAFDALGFHKQNILEWHYLLF